MKREQAAIVDERIVTDGLAFLQTGSSQADEVEQMVREAVALAALIGDGEPVFLPGGVEKGDHPVIEKIEEAAEGVVFGAPALKDQLRVVKRHGAGGAVQPHEVHDDGGRRGFGPLDVLDAAGGEGDLGVGGESRHFLG